MKVLFCEHPNKPLRGGYCSYYSEIFHALKSEFDIEFKNFIPRKTSEFDGYDAVFLGFGHTDCGEGKPQTLIRDSDIKLFPILNKEYTGLENKLDWIKEMRATATLSVHHDIDKFMSQTSIPFHRIMWSANQKQFRDYGGDYKHDLFFSGVTRPEQSENLRERVLSELNRLNGELGNFINARSHRNNYSGTMFTDDEYARHLSNSKLCLVTTGPADLVGTRFFEIFAGNRSLVICNRMNEKIYDDIIIDGVNCVMFSTVDEFYEKAQYYLNNEKKRMKIVNTANKVFLERQTWSQRAKEIRKIIGGYINE
jgi:glycosyltransferase involved in cell wall biosynthesis